jgi:hypothetical protein
MAEQNGCRLQIQIARRAVVERDCYDTRGGTIAWRKKGFELHLATATERVGQSPTVTINSSGVAIMVPAIFVVVPVY